MSWNFEFSTHFLWLNFRPQVVLWRSRCRELEMWAQGLAQMTWNANLFYYSSWLNSKPQDVLWRSHCRELEIWPQRLAQMSWDFDFPYSLQLNFKAQVVFCRSRCGELEMCAQGLAQMSWNADLFFHQFDWTSSLKVFYEGLVVENLKSEPTAWLSWAKILIYFF
jgi:hypothetical protein